MPRFRKKWFLAGLATAFALVLGYGVMSGSNAGFLAGLFNPRVDAAFGDSYGKIVFPATAGGHYKSAASGFLLGCLDSCMNRRDDIYGREIRPDSCEDFCLCFTTGRIAAYPDDFMKDMGSRTAKDFPSALACVEKYRIAK
ncbi:MAG TPA: hypothetical protein VL625_05950 [Patescibacteria group bacterium]|nr:hypothetical protein [Patescibacteria group bacterium]